MASPNSRPDTINTLRYGVDAAFAMLVGMQLDNSRLSPPSAVGANLNWINIYDAGESYTEHDHRIWLSEAGFVDIERADFFLAGGRSLITARKRK